MFLKKKKELDAEVPGGSLADISFLILIFFMVATTIDMDKGIGLVLPGEGEEAQLHKDNITNVIIDPTGKVLMDEKEVSVRNIRSEAEKMLLRKPKMVFSVKTHPRATYQAYLSVIDQLKMAKAKNISIAQ